MKFVCEVDNKACVINENDIDDPVQAAKMAFIKVQEYLDYDRMYPVTVYSDKERIIQYIQRGERHKFSCTLEDYAGHEIDVDAQNSLTAAVKGLLYSVCDLEFAEKCTSITVRDVEGNSQVFSFDIGVEPIEE